MTASFVYGKPVMQKYTPAAAILAGDVVVIGASPFVAHEDNPPFGTTTILDALAVFGGVYWMTAAVAIAPGQDVWFDTTAKKVTTVSTGNVHFGVLLAGPTGDLVGAGPAADGDLCLVLHMPQGYSSASLPGNRSEATQSTTATLTATQLLGGFINSAPAGAITLTLPTAANMVAGVKGAKAGDSFDVVIENTSGGANTITLAAGGATLRGGTAVAQNKSALIRIVLTNVGTGTEAYTAYSLIGA